ncbi:MAG: nitroreductase family protein [bacterium]
MNDAFYDLITRRRTIRRFKQTILERPALLKWINAGRLAPSAANRQPLEYLIVDEDALTAETFTCLSWAGYIKPRGTPPEGERPAAYIVVLVNKNIRETGFEYDAGAAIENIILAALADGVGSCWISSVDRPRLSEILEIPEDRYIASVIALGIPGESPTTVEAADSIKYWKDDKEQLQVPKRKIESITYTNRFRS